MIKKELHKIPYPIEYTVTTSITHRHYDSMKKWFDEGGYVYNEDYYFEWDEPGYYVPAFIWCDSELAVLFKLGFYSG